MLILTTILLLSANFLTTSSIAATCNQDLEYYYNKEYAYSGKTCPCSEPSCASLLVSALQNKNNAMSRFSSYAGYSKSAYVKLTNASGTVKEKLMVLKQVKSRLRQ